MITIRTVPFLVEEGSEAEDRIKEYRNLRQEKKEEMDEIIEKYGKKENALMERSSFGSVKIIGFYKDQLKEEEINSKRWRRSTPISREENQDVYVPNKRSNQGQELAKELKEAKVPDLVKFGNIFCGRGMVYGKGHAYVFRYMKTEEGFMVSIPMYVLDEDRTDLPDGLKEIKETKAKELREKEEEKDGE